MSLEIEELNNLYEDSKNADKEMTAEMRASILMLSGDFFNKRIDALWNRTKSLDGSQSNSPRLKVGKNWLHRAHRLYMSSILSKSPGAVVSPRNKLEIKDQKDAELCQSVWEYLRSKLKLKAHDREACSDFVGIGECATKIYFDPNRGYFKGHQQKVDENGQPVTDETMQPVVDETKPVFSGEMVFERIYPHTLFRNASAKRMEDSNFLGIEKMVDTKELKARYKDQPDKIKFIDESKEEYVVFDINKAGYSKENKQTLVREYYFKPGIEFPNGRYFHTTKAGILEEDDLPGGVFPIVWRGFDEAATRARATGLVKIARPWNAEIVRAASQCAHNSMVHSDDKIVYQAGTKVNFSSLYPGARGFAYTGTPPTVIPGRAGDQFYEYIATQEQEMNRALLLDVLDIDKINQLDPFAMMFRSMMQTQNFSLYSDKFGEFLVEVCEKALALAKFYLPDDEVIVAIGKSESINMAEFRETTPLCHKVQVMEQEQTIESRLGQMLMMQNLIQYAGAQMSREDIGKLACNMPFANWQEQFADFTVDERNCKNDFLAIERGEQPRVSARDDSAYCLKKVASRMKERDFTLLAPEIQQAYDQYEQIHLQKIQAEGQAAKQASADFIPSSGALIAADVYIEDPKDPSKAPKRARIPYDAVQWLLKTLETQGMTQDKLEAMNQGQLLSLEGSQQPSGDPAQMAQPQMQGAMQ